MNKWFRRFALLLTLACATWLHAQDLNQLLAQYKAADQADRTIQFSSARKYVAFLLQSNAMHDAETSRIDKQTEASSGSGLSTSAVTKGAVPWLFAFAVEHGALTQSVDGNVITFKGNVANAIKAINAKDYVKSFKLGESNFSFGTSRGRHLESHLTPALECITHVQYQYICQRERAH